MNSQKNNFPRPNSGEVSHASTVQVPDVFSLSRDPEIDHRVDMSTGQGYLFLGPLVPYPTDVQTGNEDTDAILPQVAHRVFKLPPEYISMQHVLNEATGAISSRLPRGTTPGEHVVKAAFDRLGVTIGALVHTKHVRPEGLRYDGVIMAQSDEGAHAKLLPPLVLKTVGLRQDDELGAVSRVATDLRASLHDGSSNDTQRSVAEVATQEFRVRASRVIRGK